MTDAPPGQGPAPADLRSRIARAEAAVVARDLRVRQRGRALTQRVKSGVVRHAGTGAAVVAGVVVLGWLLGRRPRPAEPAPEPAPASAAAGASGPQAGLSFAGLLPLVWPYLPEKIRTRLTPAMASTLLAVAAPLLARLLRRRRRPSAAPRP